MIHGATDPTPADLASLARSGISAELAAQAQIQRVDSASGGSIVDRNGRGDYAGLLFPYLWPGETHVREYRLRRDHPDFEYDKYGKKKERAKYLSPPGRGNMLYFVPGTQADWLRDQAIPAVISEGEKKNLALWTLAWQGLGDSAERPRFLPVGLSGVWNFRGTVGKDNAADGSRVDVKGVVSDFRRIEWRSRKVTIAFDVNIKDNPQVQAARWQLTRELRQRGAQVCWFEWPFNTPEGINGIDDLLGLWGAERCLELLEGAKAATLTLGDQATCERHFEAIGQDRYRMSIPALGIDFDVDRLLRERHELHGELAVRCELPGCEDV